MRLQKILAAIIVFNIQYSIFDVKAADSKTSMFNPIHTAMVSNNIAPDARAGGMGDVGGATDPDCVSQYWNPAKYPFCISRAGVQLSYTPWLRQLVNDMNIAYMSGYYRIGDYSAISASLHYFSLGEVYFADESGAADLSQSIKPYEMSVDVAYSLMLSEKFSLAAGVRYLLSDISYSRTEESSAASAFAADLACYYQNYVNIGQRECQLGLGLSLRNMGSKMTFAGTNRAEFLPTNLRLGAALMIPINEYNRFTIAADANKLLVPTYPTIEQYMEAYKNGETHVGDGTSSSSNLDAYADEVYYNKGSIAGMFSSFTDAPGGFKEELEEIQWSVGAEYVYNDRFSLRAGYHDEAQSKGNRKYFTVGAGFRMSAFTLDAAYVISTAQSNPLDQTLRFSLTFDLDGIKDLFGRR